MTERRADYIINTLKCLDYTNSLTYRLTAPDGFAVGAQYPAGTESNELAAATMALVKQAFQRANCPELLTSDWLPEILSEATIQRIKDLEQALTWCRNAMIDAPMPAVVDEDVWLSLIDRAGLLLGARS